MSKQHYSGKGIFASIMERGNVHVYRPQLTNADIEQWIERIKQQKPQQLKANFYPAPNGGYLLQFEGQLTHTFVSQEEYERMFPGIMALNNGQIQHPR